VFAAIAGDTLRTLNVSPNIPVKQVVALVVGGDSVKPAMASKDMASGPMVATLAQRSAAVERTALRPGVLQ